MLAFYILLSVALLYICYTDAKTYRIPNWVTLLLLVAYPLMLVMTYPWQGEFVWWHPLAILAGGFAISLLLLAFNLMGAGDLKLLMVLSVWAGLKGLLFFLVYTGVYGGLLVIALYLLRLVFAFYVPAQKVHNIPQVLRMKEPLPYGIAIAAGFLTVLWMGDIALMPLSLMDMIAMFSA